MSHSNTATDNQRFLVKNPKEILQILNNLAKNKTMLTVSLDHGAESFLTTVIAVDDVKHVAYLDIGCDEAFNARLLSSHAVSIANNDGISIHWTSRDLKAVALKDGQAICIGLPHDLVRVQRREYFRHPVPGKNAVICKIPFSDTTDTASGNESFLELSLLDVSVGGIGAVIPDHLLQQFSIGAHFEHCKIDFPGVGVTDLTLCVRHIHHAVMKNDTVQHRVGFEFVNPSRGNQSLIQRYTFILESGSIASPV